MRALAEAEGEGHFLFADGLVEETNVSVDLRKMEKKKKRQATTFVRIASMGLGEGEKKNKQLSTYRVVGRLREADFLLRTAHDLLDQPA